jgi:hypothetical protein
MLSFLSGLALFILGLTLISNNTVVRTGFSLGWIFGGYSPPFGLMLIPVIVGVILLFALKRQIWGWIFIGAGLIAILAGLLMGLRIYFRPTTLYSAIIMFACLAAGIGLMIRGMVQWKKR